MKYGAMYYKNTDNIGDDIQSYVALKFLPHVDYHIDRENLNCFIPNDKEYVSMIMNGWFLHNKAAWPPSPYINPLPISMHFTELNAIDIGTSYLSGLGGDYLLSHSPIGCRDIQTQKRLSDYEIPNYFSGCLTLTLKPFDNIEKLDYICVTDVDNRLIDKIKASTEREIKFITHKINPEVNLNKTFADRMNDVENLLKAYQSAHLVVTSRLHVALPCIALGTPVILVLPDNFEKDRLETYLDFTTHYLLDDFINMDIHELLDTPPPPTNNHLTIQKQLVDSCEQFIRQSEHANLDESILPSIEEYTKYVEKLSWYKNLYEVLRKNTMSTWLDCNSEISKLIEENTTIYDELLNLRSKNYEQKNNEYKAEIDVLQQKVEELHVELEKIENSKGWKVYKKLRGIK